MRSLVLCGVLLAACGASSVSYQYQASMTRPQSRALQVVIALPDLTDTRDLLKPNHKYASSIFLLEKKTSSFFRREKPYGLTHLGKKFAPVARVMRDLLYWELSHAGAKVVLLDTWGKNLSQQDLLRMAKEQGASYLMTGELKGFAVQQKDALLSRKKKVNDYNAEYRLSVARVSDGVSIWGFSFFDDTKEKQKNIRQVLRTLFQDLLPPILVKGSGFTMDQIEIDILNAERGPAVFP